MRAAQVQSIRRLQAGDIPFCEISASFWGYEGQVLRSFTIDSDPTPMFADLHQAADAAFMPSRPSCALEPMPPT